MNKRNRAKFLSDQELAERWGYSKLTLRRWRENGKGPRYIQLGEERKRTLYPIAGVIQYERRRLK